MWRCLQLFITSSSNCSSSEYLREEPKRMIHTALRRVTSGLIILSVSTFATPVFAMQNDAKDLMQQGFEMLRRGDNAGALEKFRAVISANPSNDDAWRIWKEVDQAVWVQMLAKG